ncbi:MAG: helix-turn-helix transcriptional regulator [Moorellaceae bacterium]
MCNDFSAGPKGHYCHGQTTRLPLLQPYLLLLLYQEPAHGYELVEKLLEFGFHPCLDATTVYRNLRRMEEEGLVTSQWNTQGPGPARRLYQLTPEGEDVLHSWASTIRRRKETLEKFLDRYNRYFPPERR